MRKILVIARREFLSIFFSPMAYIVITVFLVMAGYFFSVYVTNFEEASLRRLLANLGFTLLFIVPLITMRLIAEENRSGTLEVLLTDPVKDSEIVVGKFLAACGFLTAMILPTLAFVLILENLGSPDRGPILSGYIGLLLLGYMMITVGLLCSAMTKNQIVAAILAFVFLLLMWFLRWAAQVVDPALANLLNFLSLFQHFYGFGRGIVDSRHIVFYLSTIVLFLFITTRLMETRRWR